MLRNWKILNFTFCFFPYLFRKTICRSLSDDSFVHRRRRRLGTSPRNSTSSSTTRRSVRRQPFIIRATRRGGNTPSRWRQIGTTRAGEATTANGSALGCERRGKRGSHNAPGESLGCADGKESACTDARVLLNRGGQCWRRIGSRRLRYKSQ